MLRRLADFLLPPVCISCRTRVGSHGLLCGTCFAKIDFIAPPLCERLGVPLPFETGEKPLSAAAIATPPVYDRARAAAHYSETMRELVQSFKYRDRHEGLALFARWLARGLRPGAEAGGSGEGRCSGARPRRRARRLRALVLRERRLPPSYEGRCRIARL